MASRAEGQPIEWAGVHRAGDHESELGTGGVEAGVASLKHKPNTINPWLLQLGHSLQRAPALLCIADSAWYPLATALFFWPQGCSFCSMRASPRHHVPGPLLVLSPLSSHFLRGAFLDSCVSHRVPTVLHHVIWLAFLRAPSLPYLT